MLGISILLDMFDLLKTYDMTKISSKSFLIYISVRMYVWKNRGI